MRFIGQVLHLQWREILRTEKTGKRMQTLEEGIRGVGQVGGWLSARRSQGSCEKDVSTLGKKDDISPGRGEIL